MSEMMVMEWGKDTHPNAHRIYTHQVECGCGPSVQHMALTLRDLSERVVVVVIYSVAEEEAGVCPSEPERDRFESKRVRRVVVGW